MFSPLGRWSWDRKREKGGFDGIADLPHLSLDRVLIFYEHLPVEDLRVLKNLFKGQDGFTAGIDLLEKIRPFFLGSGPEKVFDFFDDPNPFLSFYKLLQDEVLFPHGLAKILPEFRFERSQRHMPSVLRGIDLITGKPARQVHFSPLGKFLIRQIFSRMDGEPGEDAIVHRYVKMLPLSCFSTVDDGG